MISLILAKKILSLFLVMALGIVLVRCGIVRSRDSKVLSMISLYLVMPCVIISSFQVKYQPEILNGLLLALATAVLLHLVLIVVVGFLGKVLKLDGVEETSLIYSNAGNLIIPIVTAILGKEWVIYTSAFLSVQLFLLWSHAKMKLCGEKGIDLKKILTNINMIAIFAGVLLFLLRIQLPAPVQDAVDSISSMVGPMGMLILGIADRRNGPEKTAKLSQTMVDHAAASGGHPADRNRTVEIQQPCSTSAGGQNNTAGYTACHLHTVRVHTDPDGAGVRQRCRLRQRYQCGNDPAVYRHDAADGGTVPDVSTCERSVILAPVQAAIKNPRK